MNLNENTAPLQEFFFPWSDFFFLMDGHKKGVNQYAFKRNIKFFKKMFSVVTYKL